MTPQHTTIDKMTVATYDSNAALGEAASEDFARIVTQAIADNGEVSVILATGNSQLSFMEALRKKSEIQWDKISVFHMDEYLGMSADHPASFRRFMQEKLVSVFQPRNFYGVDGDAPNIEIELARYTTLLAEYPPVVCVLGIGENGHLAFNDPPADFYSDKLIHVVELDAVCRQQQVGEGHFANLDAVPTHALSLTIPALLKPAHVMALVPETRKAKVVKAALQDPVSEMCPATILRTHAHVKLYLDRESSSLL